MKVYRKLLLSSLVALLSLPARAEFNLDKYRIVIGEGERRADLRIFNNGGDYSSYRVQMIDMQMNEDGKIQPVEAYDYSAKKLVRVGPRLSKNITPHTNQTIRFRARGSKTPGEFRSHLLIEELLPPYEGDLQGMILRPNLKMIIPIFVTKGELDVNLKAADFGFEHKEQNNELSFAIYRQGNSSAFGNILIEDNQGQEVYREHNIGIYREIKRRKFTIKLPKSITSGNGLTLKFLQPETETLIFQHSITTEES